MGVYNDKFFNSLNLIVDQIVKDGNWTYSQVSKQTFEGERKADRSFNCADGVCYALKKAKMMPTYGKFYFAFGKLKFNGSAQQIKDLKKSLYKYYKLVRTSKLKRGDIVGFKDMSHTCIYLGDGLYADFGTKANVKGIKKKIIAKHTYGTHKPCIVLRPKVIYYPKYKGKEKESIIRALKDAGINSSYENREKIAAYNGIKNYVGSAEQNLKLLSLLRKGKLIK